MSKSSSSAEAQVRALQHDPGFDRFRSVQARRALTLVTFGLLAVTVAAFWRNALIVALLLGAVTVGGGFLLRRSVRLVADAPDAALDERQIARRNAAYRQAYVILATGVMLALLLLYIAADGRRIDFTLEPRHIHALFWAATGAGALLPSAIMAWTEPEI
jgi:hypothetical protein